MVSLQYNDSYGLYEAALESGPVFVALPEKQEVIDAVKSYGFTEFIDRT